MRVCLLLSVLVLSGCASSPYPRTSTITEVDSTHRYGYRSYDPCIRCGEGWIFLNLDDTAHLKNQ